MPRQDRDPHRLIWSGCPTRGLDNCLAIFYEARKEIPDLNLHIYYGWQGTEFVAKGDASHPQLQLRQRLEAMDQTNVTWHGRVNKETLWTALLQSSFFMFPTSFFECGVVSAQEAQACGVIPITNPLGGLLTMVRNGVLIGGDPATEQVRRQYLDSLVWLCRHPNRCEEMRATMVPWALDHFRWDRVIDHHERLSGCLAPFQISTGLGDEHPEFRQRWQWGD